MIICRCSGFGIADAKLSIEEWRQQLLPSVAAFEARVLDAGRLQGKCLADEAPRALADGSQVALTNNERSTATSLVLAGSARPTRAFKASASTATLMRRFEQAENRSGRPSTSLYVIRYSAKGPTTNWQ